MAPVVWDADAENEEESAEGCSAAPTTQDPSATIPAATSKCKFLIH